MSLRKSSPGRRPRWQNCLCAPVRIPGIQTKKSKEKKHSPIFFPVKRRPERSPAQRCVSLSIDAKCVCNSAAAKATSQHVPNRSHQHHALVPPLPPPSPFPFTRILSFLRQIRRVVSSLRGCVGPSPPCRCFRVLGSEPHFRAFTQHLRSAPSNAPPRELAALSFNRPPCSLTAPAWVVTLRCGRPHRGGI